MYFISRISHRMFLAPGSERRGAHVAEQASRHGAKVLEAKPTREAGEGANCCSHFSFDLETPVKENSPFPVPTGYVISRKHACYLRPGDRLGFAFGFRQMNSGT